MAKRKEIVLDEANIDQMLESGFLKITTPDNTLEAKVLHFRKMGYNNNQIASLLRVTKATVDGIN